MPSAAALDPKPDPPLGICLSFGIGTVGTAVLLNTVTVYLPAFMATVLGRSAALAGLLLAFSKLYDVVCDIVIAVASDRTRSRLGRRRPYLLAGALLGSLTFCQIFDPPTGGGDSIVWEMGLLLVLYSTGYSLFNVPYLAMPPEIAATYHGRTRLLSFRTLFVSIGQFIALSVSGWLLHGLGGGRAAYAVMGYVLAAVILSAELATFFGLRRTAAGTGGPAVPRPGPGAWGTLLHSRPFLLLMLAKFLQLLSVATAITGSLLFMLNVLGVGYLGQASLSLAQNVAIAASMPGWVWVSHRVGKRSCAVGAILLYAAGSLSWLLAGAGEGTAGIVARGVVLGAGAGGILLMGSAMLPDVMELDTLQTGLRREGVFSGAFAIVEKTAFAIGSGLTGLYLGYAGYVPTMRGELVHQPDSVRAALYGCVAVLPAVTICLSIVALMFYPLDEAALVRSRAAGGRA